MIEEANNPPSQDVADRERGGDRRLSTCSACDGTTWVRCSMSGWKPCLECTPKAPDQAQWESMMKPIFRLMKAKGIGAMTVIRDGNKGSFSLIPEPNDALCDGERNIIPIRKHA